MSVLLAVRALCQLRKENPEYHANFELPGRELPGLPSEKHLNAPLPEIPGPLELPFALPFLSLIRVPHEGRLPRSLQSGFPKHLG